MYVMLCYVMLCLFGQQMYLEYIFRTFQKKEEKTEEKQNQQ